MHACPECDMACDCDGDDLWHDWPFNLDCTHECDDDDDDLYFNERTKKMTEEKQEISAFYVALLARHDLIITIRRDGTWNVWNALDDYYAQSETDYLVSIALKNIAELLRT